MSPRTIDDSGTDYSPRKPDNPFSVIRFARLAVRLRALGEGLLPQNPGAALRDSFGASLRVACCPDGTEGECAPCPSRDTCPYLYIFQTPPPPDATKLRKNENIPRPFVIYPWEGQDPAIADGDPLEFELILVGRSLDYLPHLMVSLGRMAAMSIKGSQVPLRLEGIDQLTSSESTGRAVLFDGYRQEQSPRPQNVPLDHLPEEIDTLSLEFLSPTNIRSHGRMLRDLPFTPLAGALLRRMSSLAVFHCGTPLDLDFKQMKKDSESIRLEESELRLIRLSRYSAAQKQKVPQQGILGRVTYGGESLRHFMPLLALGEILHVGKDTVCGLGRFRILR